MLNIEVAQDSFWQFARFWKTGVAAKFEMSCENGFLEMNMSAVIGHPDNMHFPPPPIFPSVPPTPHFIKRKSPSKLRRQVCRQQKRADEVLNHKVMKPMKLKMRNT